jgi:hypothetical protein
MRQSVVTPTRFAKGRTFDEYVKYAGSPENLAREAFGNYYPDAGSRGTLRKDNSGVLRKRYARARWPTTRPRPSSGSPPSPAAPRRSS